jgi:hypothetical protein
MDVCESDLIVQEHFITFQETEETAEQSLFVVIKNCLRIQNKISRIAGARAIIMAPI